MRSLFLTTAAFAALVMIAPVGNAHAGVAVSHLHPDSYWETFDKPVKGSTAHHAEAASDAKEVARRTKCADDFSRGELNRKECPDPIAE
jgi:hypothetical protein